MATCVVLFLQVFLFMPPNEDRCQRTGGVGPDFRLVFCPRIIFFSFALLLGKYLAYEISLFLASDEIAPLISIQVMAISSHQIDFSFIYVSCSCRNRKKSCRRRCIWQDCRINIYDGPGGVAFGPGDFYPYDWMAAKCNEILFAPVAKWIFFLCCSLVAFQVLIKCKLEGCAGAGVFMKSERPLAGCSRNGNVY